MKITIEGELYSLSRAIKDIGRRFASRIEAAHDRDKGARTTAVANLVAECRVKLPAWLLTPGAESKKQIPPNCCLRRQRAAGLMCLIGPGSERFMSVLIGRS
jgi:hypothetical protein